MKKGKAGIVYTGGHLVEVVFPEEDFLHLWGGGPEDYRDFLLARMERLTHLEEKKGIEPLYHITVPFPSQGARAAWPIRRSAFSGKGPRLWTSNWKSRYDPAVRNSYFSNRSKPACSKWWSVVKAREIPRCRMRTKLMQSVRLQSLSFLILNSASPW